MIDGHPYILANHRWIEERGQCSATLEARLAVHEEAGRTVTILANRDQVIALFAVADTIKPSSIEAISEMKALGVVPIMLTGDNAATARTVGHLAGISEIRGNLLPEDKLKAIEEFQGRYGVTAMTGDGINDAPALAKANIGFAMGAAGTHTAMEAADVVVMNDDLRRCPRRFASPNVPMSFCGRTSPWLWASRRYSCSWPSLMTRLCGWRSLPTWAQACWWFSMGFGFSRQSSDGSQAAVNLSHCLRITEANASSRDQVSLNRLNY